MRARCTDCDKAIEFSHEKGKRLSDIKCDCGGHGGYQQMRKREVLGEAPLPGFTHNLFGKIYHMVYSSGAGQFLYDRANARFVNIGVTESIK